MHVDSLHLRNGVPSCISSYIYIYKSRADSSYLFVKVSGVRFMW